MNAWIGLKWLFNPPVNTVPHGGQIQGSLWGKMWGLKLSTDLSITLSLRFVSCGSWYVSRSLISLVNLLSVKVWLFADMTLSQFQISVLSLCPSVSFVCPRFFLFPSLSACLPVCPFVCLMFICFVCLPLSILDSACPPVCLFVCLTFTRFVCLTVSIFVFACLLVCLCICLSVCYESKECDGRSTPWTIDTRTFKYRMRDSWNALT